MKTVQESYRSKTANASSKLLDFFLDTTNIFFENVLSGEEVYSMEDKGLYFRKFSFSIIIIKEKAMSLERHHIENWTEDDLLNLPDEEDDFHEFKSSKTPFEELKKKIGAAASAFWNSGGGLFIAGIDDKTGKIDGGFPKKYKRQKICDWVDQILSNVQPTGKYARKPISRKRAGSLIEPDKIVLVIAFDSSVIIPHMAPDKKFYIRAGAHTVSAGYFLVEALYARRGFQKPQIRSLLRVHERRSDIVQLVVISLNELVALDVSISIESDISKQLQETFKDRLPMGIPVIDQKHPFKADISPFVGGSALYLECCRPLQLKISYRDILGNKYTEQQTLDCKYSLGPLGQVDEPFREISKELRNLSIQLQQLNFKVNR